MTTSSIAGRVRDFASLVKLSHSVFALPFALLSLLVASAGRPQPATLALVMAAVVAARTAAMAYNRFADRRLDRDNPRTAGREIPRGAVSPAAALWLTAAASAVFVACCQALAPICGWLSLPTLAWLLGYSHTKRVSWLCHVWLGVALGLAPVAAWLAVDGAFSARMWLPALLALGVVCWVAGFDVLYACQDEAFDRRAGLRSIPARFGAARAMWIARVLHAAAVVAFAAFAWVSPLGIGFAAGVALGAGLLVWQHRLLSPNDLSRIDMAFFTANGAIAVVMFLAGCLDLYLL